MVRENRGNLRHLLVAGTAHTESYAPPKSGGPKQKPLPPRDRKTQGDKLLGQLEEIRKKAVLLGEERTALGIDAGDSIYLQLESEPWFDLKLESLESVRAGIELVAVKKVDEKTMATCLVPDGQLSHFVRLVADYLERNTAYGKPANQSLIDRIADIRAAALEALWTDEAEAFPRDNEDILWEVWLRVGDDREAFLRLFRGHAQQIGLRVSEKEIRFPERTVVVAQANKSQMSRSVKLLNCIAEVRRAKETADFFSEMSPIDQHDWLEEALSRLNRISGNLPVVCILDTGINNQHPLLKSSLDTQDMHTYDPTWGVFDDRGHGTEMAGLSLFGDLTDFLASSETVTPTHRLESVKILPPRGENPPNIYGAVTTEAVARVEIAAPERNRTICMAVSTTDFRDRGRPSSWSAALDDLASGSRDDQKRLIVICAGNTVRGERHQYPASNYTDGIHDPGQAWNALTVGAFTEKDSIDPATYPGWNLIAPPGDLSPCSCTSVTWKTWPIKPDIVMEGGNMAVDPAIGPHTGGADYIDSLSLLSTNRDFLSKPFVIMYDTSAATALASRMAAMLQAEYPQFWPETIRALIVHSAEWTDAMRSRFPELKGRSRTERLLRCYGFGVPDMPSAMWSAANALTLIAQDSLQPFDRIKGKYRTRDMNLHHVPWPKEALEELGETPVEMRVTLSYYIEPNPGERGWIRRYSYASHGLRFDVKTPTEDLREFRRRINRIAFEEEKGDKSKSDASRWDLGPDLRSLGSLHSDKWTGTAAELAQRGYIAVYPVLGWWRERPKHERWSRRARYALIVTIKTPSTDVDLYTPVVNSIVQEIEI
jgi:hypothetical protein